MTVTSIQDCRCWCYEADESGRHRLKPGYPQDIQNDFLGFKENGVDAAFNWGVDNRAYLFSGKSLICVFLLFFFLYHLYFTC